MKKIIMFAVFTIFAFCFNANAQTTGQNETEINRIQLINALERAQTEVKASRKYIDELTKQVSSKQSIIDEQTKKEKLSDSVITGLQSEVKNLRLAIAEAEAALEVRKQEVAQLQTDLKKTRKKLKLARAFAKYLTVAAGVLAAIVVIK